MPGSTTATKLAMVRASSANRILHPETKEAQKLGSCRLPACGGSAFDGGRRSYEVEQEAEWVEVNYREVNFEKLFWRYHLFFLNAPIQAMCVKEEIGGLVLTSGGH